MKKQKERKENSGKWKDLGFNNKQRDEIYSKVRSKSQSILVKKCNKTYRKILAIELQKEYILQIKKNKSKDIKK